MLESAAYIVIIICGLIYIGRAIKGIDRSIY